MGSTLKVDNIVGTSGTSAPITLSGDTATLGTSVIVPGGTMLSSTTVSGTSTQYISFTSLGNHSAFNDLKFIFSQVVPITDNVEFVGEVAISGTSYLTSNYQCVGQRTAYNGGSPDTSLIGTNARIIRLQNVGNDGLMSGELNLYSHNNSTHKKIATWTTGHRENNDEIVNVTGTSCYDASDGTDPLTAIRFFFSSGNFANGSTITMYGIKIS